MPCGTTDTQLHFAALLLPNSLVPTVRLELTQLSPLPPQDSVSTNFTTSALRYCASGANYISSDWPGRALQQKNLPDAGPSLYFGMSLVLESGAAGVGAGVAGAVCAGAESITLPDTRGLEVAI